LSGEKFQYFHAGEDENEMTRQINFFFLLKLREYFRWPVNLPPDSVVDLTQSQALPVARLFLPPLSVEVL